MWEAAGEGATVTWHSRVFTSIGEGWAELSGKLAFSQGQLCMENPEVHSLQLDYPPPMDRVTQVQPDYDPHLLRLHEEPVRIRAVLAPQDLEVQAMDPVGQELHFVHTVKPLDQSDPDGIFAVRVSWEGMYKSNLEEFELLSKETRYDLEGLSGVGPGGVRNHVWIAEEMALLRHKESGETLTVSVTDLPQDFLSRSAEEPEKGEMSL